MKVTPTPSNLRARLRRMRLAMSAMSAIIPLTCVGLAAASCGGETNSAAHAGGGGYSGSSGESGGNAAGGGLGGASDAALDASDDVADTDDDALDADCAPKHNVIIVGTCCADQACYGSCDSNGACDCYGLAGGCTGGLVCCSYKLGCTTELLCDPA